MEAKTRKNILTKGPLDLNSSRSLFKNYLVLMKLNNTL